MKTAFMETLGIEVPLKRNERYIDEGFVPNVLAKVIEIEKQFNVMLIPYDNSPLILTKGYTFEFYCGVGVNKKRNVHIFYVNQKNDIRNIFARGHEETHAVEKFNNIENLLRKIDEKYPLELFIEDLKDMDSESLANLGGVYSLLRQGYIKGQIKSEFHSFDKNIFDPSSYLEFMSC